MKQEFVNIFDRSMTVISSVMLSTDEHNSDNIKVDTIGNFLAPQRQSQYIGLLKPIWELCPNLEEKLKNIDRVAALKKALPAGIMSGVAEGGISERNIVERNNVVPFEIDAKDNPALYDWEAVKETLGQSPFVAYVGLSCTRLGVFGLIPVEDGMKHKEHFDAIEHDFSNHTFTFMQSQDTEPTVLHGIHLDRAPSNIASKRFVSYDPTPYWNTAAQVYTKTVEPVKLYQRTYTATCEGEFNIEQFFHKHGISYNIQERRGGVQYAVTCPWIELHSSRSKNESAVFVDSTGIIGYHCFHAHCQDKHWHQYREFYEPDAYKNSFEF